jgi:hypothetical protein
LDHFRSPATPTGTSPVLLWRMHLELESPSWMHLELELSWWMHLELESSWWKHPELEPLDAPRLE